MRSFSDNDIDPSGSIELENSQSLEKNDRKR